MSRSADYERGYSGCPCPSVPVPPINASGVYFASSSSTMSVTENGTTFGISSDQFRVYALLHELGHLIGMGTEIDSNGYDNSFNRGILTNCLNIKPPSQ